MQRKKYNDTEVAEVLKQIAELLLDENVEAKVATTYCTVSRRYDSIKKITIPGSNYWISGSQTLNTNRATSVKIGNFTIRPSRNLDFGFNIITPDGKDYLISLSMPSHLRAAANYLWKATLAKCDKRYHEVLDYIKEIRGLGIQSPKMTKGTLQTKFEAAQKQLESLGVPKESQVHLQKMREGRE
ncbi:MAG: hypothetical protein J6R22_00995 [Alphaproteobacteria bacterium]|nr:hypothetical protein [Alphaproteobacteria bacterium]